MSIIPSVGRRNLKTRIVIALLYLVLTTGAVTMVYPFMIMLGSSITSGADMNSYAVIPNYLLKVSAIFPKYAEDRYAGDIELINSYYGTEYPKVDDVVAPKLNSASTALRRQALDWDRFVRSLPAHYKQAGFEGYMQSPSDLKVRYQRYCRKRFGNDIAKLNRIYLEESESFQTVYPPFERFKAREWEPDKSAKMQDWLKFRQSLPAYMLRPIMVDPAFAAFLRDGRYEASIDKLNKSWGTKLKSFSEARLAPTPPTHPNQRKDWETFVREMMPFRYMKVAPGAEPVFRAYLKQRYGGRIAELNRRYDASYASFEAISLPAKMPSTGSALVDWMDFIAKRVPLDAIRVVNTENLYRERLAKTMGGLAAVNKAFGTDYKSLLAVTPPVHNADWYYVSHHTGELRRYFLTRNYATVIDYIVLHGNAVLTTFIFVAAVILTHLIVNPMCAYALSRYNLPYAYKVLLFLLATMAFPAEIAAIPNFLLLKQLHLLNTFWALILPGMANGYAIFLLKGFFDSLPKELYEAGIIDGASEATMFRKITIPMSKPIFAVIALQSFQGAYGAFMFALLVCQDPRMWTMMVWLYQLQAYSPQYITMAALTLAAIPTLLVFVFAQNVIMKGIIIPTFK